jgi:hypothetical protein
MRRFHFSSAGLTGCVASMIVAATLLLSAAQGPFEVAYDEAMDAHGKIVSAGFSTANETADIALARYLP